MNATLKRLILAMAFALPIGALVLPPAPAQAQTASSTGMEQPTGKTSKAHKKKGAKKAKARTKSTTTG